MIRPILFLFLLLNALFLSAQQTDSIKPLEVVEVKGLDLKMEYLKCPASVTVIKQRDLNRFANTSLVPIMNTIPGVRMEERSPGSYRLSIRGSLLRSPFGVRNIKVYWKDIPLTDAGGNTYINLLDLNSIGRIEVLKGPAGSIYGAGTGGVVSFSGQEWGDSLQNRGFAQVGAGAYGAKNAAAASQWNTQKGSFQAFQSYYTANGYRRNSEMHRAVTQVSGKWKLKSKQLIDYIILYSDLQYQTPGGLTYQQWMTDAKQARPATALLPSAEQQKAGIFNKTFLAGLTYYAPLSKHWNQAVSLSTTRTDFSNPFITNYEDRLEWNFALRSKWTYSKTLGKNTINYNIGFESINGLHRIDSTGNKNGIRSGSTARDQIKAAHRLLFTQGQWAIGDQIILNAGLSWNAFGYTIHRIVPIEYQVHPNFKTAILPRLASLFKIAKDQYAQISVSKGYSSPTLSEVRPSAGGFYGDLQAEKGWNIETGFKGRLFYGKFNYDITAFQFLLTNAIVRQLDNRGAEYFMNAGKVSQKGIEVYLDAFLIQRSYGIIRFLKWMNSSSFSRFRFVRYVAANVDYSGNKLTGVPSKWLNTGLDLGIVKGFYAHTNVTYTASLPLSDANDVFANDYRLVQLRVGWRKNWGKKQTKTDIFLSGDNLLNQQYSLGNDINAFGKRFYNPAPLANWMVGFKLQF